MNSKDGASPSPLSWEKGKIIFKVLSQGFADDKVCHTVQLDSWIQTIDGFVSVTKSLTTLLLALLLRPLTFKLSSTQC